MGGDRPRVVAVGLRDQPQRPAKCRGQGVDLKGQLFEHGQCPLVVQGVYGVEAQRVDVELPQPHQRVVQHEPAHLVAARAVEVERRTPRRRVPIGEVRAELGQPVAAGAQVVVDDVETHPESAGMAGVDEPVQRSGAAVRLVHRVQPDTVVSPAMAAAEAGQRHQLDQGHPQLGAVVESGDGRVEGALGRERANVQLIDHCLVEPHARPVRVGPRVRIRVDGLSRTRRPLGQPPRPGVGQRLTTVEPYPVPGAGRQVAARPPPPSVGGLHRLATGAEHQLDPLGPGRPHLDALHRESVGASEQEPIRALWRSRGARGSGERKVSG